MAANVGNYKDRSLNSESDERELLLPAYSLFEDFKGLIVDFLISSNDREVSRKLFLQINSAGTSFRLMEYELGLIYQLLHTKLAVLVDKDKSKRFELIFTYVLLIEAIVLDVISGIKLIFSDWVLVSLYLKSWKKYVPKVEHSLLIRPIFMSLLKKLGFESQPQRSRSESLSRKMMSIRKRNIFATPRWSLSVSQYNMLGYCLDEKKDIEDLKCFIFEELKLKSSKAKNPGEAKMVCSERGESALFGTSSYIKLKWSINEFQYAESLLLWHLATQLCYSSSEDKELAADKNRIDHDQHKKKEESTNRNIDSKRISKLISDYMFYLLVMKPTMLGPVLANWQIVFQDTFEEAKKCFIKYSISDHAEACNSLIKVKTKFRPAAVKGPRSKSVLFDACILAQQLQHLEDDQWKLMSKVWVELLAYGVINWKPIVHAQKTSRGGEFFTFTWLLMNHLGLGSHFNEQEEQAGTKIVTVK
ncbi:hypothetical protein FEM48_Zijuj05G0012600 [Ziziphus jujuba var. spinosa]|uniref:DUF4220 domain-containing protein n=1 Tax=Ziziphus jujuba var. spinosa TaxID=714518 RepID=A0A978VBY3_ZIZJJ|nr:hypothetical protein FEM48_Zijuj05G0012600 [Ziziphus jujuba var. spinosa]